MNQNQANDLDSLKEVKDLEVEFPAILTDIPEYQDETDGLQVEIVSADLAIKVQANIPDEDMDSVTVMKKLMADTMEGVVVRAGSKAKGLKLPTLEKQFDKPFSYFFYATKDVAIERTEAYEELLKFHKTELVNIKTEDYTAIHDTIAAYKGCKEVPKVTKKKKKAAGTDALALALKRGKKRKKTMLKLLVNFYKVVNPIIAGRAKLAAKKVTLSRHIFGKYQVSESITGVGIANATITEVHTSKKGNVKTRKFLPDENGSFNFGKHSLGEYLLNVEAKDFDNTSFSVKFQKNEPNVFEIKMKRILPKNGL